MLENVFDFVLFQNLIGYLFTLLLATIKNIDLSFLETYERMKKTNALTGFLCIDFPKESACG